MKQLQDFINEKLSINKDSKIKEDKLLITINFTMYKSYSEQAQDGKLSPAYLGKCISDDLYYMVNESRKRNRKGSLKESYKDSPYYKKLADLF